MADAAPSAGRPGRATRLHAADVVLPVVGEPVRDGAVAVSGDRVVDVGPIAALARRRPSATVRRWPGVLVPGLVNAHTHLQYSGCADLAGAGLQFPEWIRTLTSRRAQTDDAGWQAATRVGLHAALTTGTTCIADVVTDPCVLAPTARSGVAGVSFVEVVGQDATTWAQAGRSGLLAALAAASPGRTIGVSPHTLYTVAPSVWADCAEIARSRGLRLHTHLAETTAEDEFVRHGTGPFAAWLDRVGLQVRRDEPPADLSPAAAAAAALALGPDVSVAHGVHTDAGDRRLLRDAGVVVVLCARSNRILGAGEPPVADYLAEGSPVAVGTDSLASSPDLDVLAEVNALYDLARRQGVPAAGLARRLVEAATLGGATSLGLTDVGRLEPGARADLAVLDVPTDSDADGDPYQALVTHGPGRCVATVLGGMLVHRGTPTRRVEPAAAVGGPW